jgi:D-beta-D-heptose 7-phosphate kinase/D-beta-D-heptose 1-phosphate adenosyltransferase
VSDGRLPAIGVSRAHALIDHFTTSHVTVVGDVMLDRFVVGRVNRLSPEAPVPIVHFHHEEFRLGGAANVAHNIRALGAAVSLVGVVGDDEDRQRLYDELRARDLDPSGLIVDPDRRTTTKLRVVTTRNQQVARIDYEDDSEIGADLQKAVSARVDHDARQSQAIIVSDYQKGVIAAEVAARAIAAGVARDIPVLVDPKVPHMSRYAGATLVTPNHAEAELAAGVRIRTAEDGRAAARALRDRLKVEGVLITLGEHGLTLSHAGVEGSLPATAREVADVTGAGDTVIATLALAMAAGATSSEAAHLANEAAGIVVGKFGAATVSRDELRRCF